MVVTIDGSSRLYSTLAESKPLPRSLSHQHRTHYEYSKHIAYLSFVFTTRPLHKLPGILKHSMELSNSQISEHI